MRLSDKEKKKIIAAYSECGNYSAVARKHHVSRTTVKNLVEKHPETYRRFEEKQEQNTKDILAHMDEKRELVCDFIDLYLNELTNRDKLEKANLKEISMTFGIVVDKFTRAKEAIQEKEGSEHEKIIIIDDIPKEKDGNEQIE